MPCCISFIQIRSRGLYIAWLYAWFLLLRATFLYFTTWIDTIHINEDNHLKHHFGIIRTTPDFFIQLLEIIKVKIIVTIRCCTYNKDSSQRVSLSEKILRSMNTRQVKEMANCMKSLSCICIPILLWVYPVWYSPLSFFPLSIWE